MAKTRKDLERALQKSFPTENRRLFPSTAVEPEEADDVKSLLLSRDKRGLPPLTQERFVIDEPPARVEWERAVRQFLMALPDREAGHRVTAPMVYEWATGRTIAEDVKAEGVDPNNWRGGAASGSANRHLRWINWVLSDYFGKSYKTRIAGRLVGKAYTVPKSFKIEYRLPSNVTLWPEWKQGLLDPNPRTKS